jgi:hypothetical protein
VLALDPERFNASFERATALAELKRAPVTGAEARRGWHSGTASQSRDGREPVNARPMLQRT